ncbi:MAG: hypothetical protein Q9191_007724 [Dirinaria sp. TL-2023a]
MKVLVLVAILSSCGNVLWALQAFRSLPPKALHEDVSLYARLERDVPTPFRDDTIFSHPNRTIADEAWNSWVVDPGIVALPHSWVKGKMLPQAQKWPWDGDKGVYLLNGYHNLHCLQMIRNSLLQAVEGSFGAWDADADRTLEHNLHCIESLRQDTLCNADDTPRYSGYSKKEVSGVMQTRMCRSFDKLEAWARDHTACYRDIGRDVEGFPQIEKYKFCPDGYVFSATGSPTPPWLTGSGISHPGEE